LSLGRGEGDFGIMSKMLWAEFQGDTETAVVVAEIEKEINFLREDKERRLREVGRGLTPTEQGWYNALFWVRARLEDVQGIGEINA